MPFLYTASDCGPSFQPYTLVESQTVRFTPTKRYRSSNGQQRRFTTSTADSSSLSLAFRTLRGEGTLLRVDGAGGTTRLEVEDGVLVYKTRSSPRPQINMTTEVTVNDGGWHTVKLSVDAQRRVLHVNLDQQVCMCFLVKLHDNLYTCFQ